MLKDAHTHTRARARARFPADTGGAFIDDLSNMGADGIYGFHSSDGIEWRMLGDGPIIGPLHSQTKEVLRRYVCAADTYHCDTCSLYPL